MNFSSSPQIDTSNFLKIISENPEMFNMIDSQTLNIRQSLLDSNARLNFAEQLIDDLAII